MRSRFHHISIWLNDKELSYLKVLSEKSGLKKDPLIRSLIMGQKLRAKPTEEYCRILRELSAIGNNINQIARIANTNRKIGGEEISKAVRMLDDVWRKIKDVG